MKKYNHLNLVEREKMFAWKESGLSLREISIKLGRNHTTLSRELKRNKLWQYGYIPFYAQRKAARVARRKRFKAPLKSPEILLYLRKHLRMKWSPETIYRYIYSTKTRTDKLSRYLTCKHKTITTKRYQQ